MTWDQDIRAALVERFGDSAIEVFKAAMEVGGGDEYAVTELLTMYCMSVAKGRIVHNPRGWMARHRRNAEYRNWLERARRGARAAVYVRRRSREGPASPDSEAEDSEASSWLGLAMVRLPDQLRDAIESRFSGLTLQETAQRLGLGSPAAASRLVELGLCALRRDAAKSM